MKAEILTIGDEILIGQIVNTNSVWMAQQLNLAGIQVVHMASVSDEENAIIKALTDAESRADFVFITGGLGPTKDDITKKVFASYFGVQLVLNDGALKNLDNYFAKRGRELNEINRKQALVPEGCIVIKNSNGTAPGMWMKKGNTVFVSMPGVPYEMQGMMTEGVLPKIKSENVLPKIYHKSILTQGIGESAIAEIVEAWEDALIEKNIKLAYLPQPGLVKLRLSSYGKDMNELKKNIEEEIVALNLLIGKYIFGYENYGEETPTLQGIVSELLRERKQTLALAESCTGGYISSLFTSISGASEIFKGAMVPYTNLSKSELLQVENGLFTTVGSVSKEVVEQLAQNVIKKFDSDYSISISGIAGPTGGTPEKPVGTVWVAVANKNRVVTHKFQFGDNRQRNIIMTASAAINMLKKLILNEI
ncbi:competence/damage-inducible protein A [Aurantibacillus circumpalustris]|uniref:competence/damage-inducible protein A n=1 Tax=Aurantibacillus circumpalustris TaxID=3036359 RepID=UPI00295A8E3D|nr:competence/damage-inducible protein A [Aurantibacillus circumpalustris]